MRTLVVGLPWAAFQEQDVRPAGLQSARQQGGAAVGPSAHPQRAPWVWDFTAEFSQFPYAAYDDRADALAQLVQWALDRMGRKKKVQARASA